MAQKIYILGCPLPPPLYHGDESPYLMVLKSLRHFVDELTVSKIKAGVLEFPEGEGEFYMLPALVEEAPIKPSQGQSTCPVCKGPFMYWPRRDDVEVVDGVFQHKVCPSA